MSSIFKPKFFTVLQLGISKKQLLSDSLSGVVVGIVALPLAIAFAVASGVSPEKGLITAVISGFLISLLGGSRVQIGGPTGAFIVILYGIIEQYGLNGLLISTVLAGIILVVFGLLRLGALLKYFPQPLIVGFTSGIAVVIFSTQIRDALGLDIIEVPSGFIDKWRMYITSYAQINYWALFITLVTILITAFSKRFIKQIPGSLIAIVFITLSTIFFDLPVATIETFFGSIPNKIGITGIDFKISDLKMYLAPALTIALLGGIESLLSAVVADGMIGGNHRSNTELIAQGIANIVTPFFGGIPATGAIARTATNVKNGGRTPVAGMVHALTLLLIMLVMAPWARLIPMSCLAGILIVVAYNMSEWRTFKSILKASYFDSLILLATFFLTVLVDLTIAIEVGVVLSALLFMKRMADLGKNEIVEFDEDLIDNYSKLPDQVGVYEISGPLFFASAKQYLDTMQSLGFKKKILIIRMRHVPFIDSTGLENFTSVLQRLNKQGVVILLSGVKRDVMKELSKSKVKDLLISDCVFEKFEHACEKAKKTLLNS